MNVPERRTRLRELRLERNISQERLAAQTGIGYRTLRRIEAGGSGSFRTRQVLADYFDTTVRDLFPDIFELTT